MLHSWCAEWKWILYMDEIVRVFFNWNNMGMDNAATKNRKTMQPTTDTLEILQKKRKFESSERPQINIQSKREREREEESGSINVNKVNTGIVEFAQLIASIGSDFFSIFNRMMMIWCWRLCWKYMISKL